MPGVPLLPHVGAWIDRRAPDDDLVVKVGPRAAPRASREPDDLSALHLLTRRHANGIEVTEAALDVVAVVQQDGGGTNVNANLFRCPQDKIGMFEKEGASYEWNTDLNGRRLDETRSSNVRLIKVVVINGEPIQQTNEEKTLRFPPETTPLLLDYEDFHPRPPKHGKNVVYMDGHTAGFELPPEITAP